MITYVDKFDEYGLLIHDGGSSFILISFCPWCGTELPESKRDSWFQTLAERGVDDPTETEIPEEFLSSRWWRSS